MTHTVSDAAAPDNSAAISKEVGRTNAKTAPSINGLIEIEKAAEELDLSPYWLRQYMRASGFKEVANGSLYIRREDFRALQEEQTNVAHKAQGLREDQVKEVKKQTGCALRPPWQKLYRVTHERELARLDSRWPAQGAPRREQPSQSQLGSALTKWVAKNSPRVLPDLSYAGTWRDWPPALRRRQP